MRRPAHFAGTGKLVVEGAQTLVNDRPGVCYAGVSFTGANTYWLFAADSRTVFNGKIERKNEQFRFSASRNAEVVFNADIDSVGYLTPDASSGAVYDFNCALAGGYPRPGGAGTFIFR